MHLGLGWPRTLVPALALAASLAGATAGIAATGVSPGEPGRTVEVELRSEGSEVRSEVPADSPDSPHRAAESAPPVYRYRLTSRSGARAKWRSFAVTRGIPCAMAVAAIQRSFDPISRPCSAR